ncbi:MAG TPA: DUF5666 domain-containing protein [Haliangiales bacterium]|nr:DUF5666 domain-containing protein [Haliangiales bacterium]
MRIITYLALVVALIIPASAFAHGGGQHIMGTVKAVDAKSLTVETTEKKQVKVAFDEQTRFEKAGASASAQDLSVGERVVVHTTTRPGVAEPVAIMVKFGARDSARPK